jgi:ABC-type dipeptide/oligopeptide/nickel transport system permease component
MRLLVLALRRVAWMPPTLLGLTLIVFAVSHVIPADPARVMAGENASAAQVEALKAKFGLDKPLPQQFVRYVTNVLSGDMGISLYSQRPISIDLLSRLPATFELAIAAIIVAVSIGLPRGVVSAL